MHFNLFEQPLKRSSTPPHILTQVQVNDRDMSPNKYRAQILHEPSQHQALADLAAKRSISISQAVREILAEYFAASELDEQQRREIEALEALASLRHTIQAEHGTLPEDFLAKARTERAEDLHNREEPGL